MSSKINIRSLSLADLIESITSIGEKSFRAKQIFEWLWKKNVGSFDEMTSLSKEFRDKLLTTYIIDKIVLAEKQISSDKTIKCAFRTHDGHIIEGVLIPVKNRMTACISSQVGCSLACKFCATGKLKRLRNLSFSEIYDQAFIINQIATEHYDTHLSNIVYMGMGEPMLNYTNVKISAEMISSEDGMAMSPKRITVSTAGIAKNIKKLGDDDVKFNLALSLHAAQDNKRSKIMEINNSNNLEALAEAIKYFYEKTGSRITFEYIIFKDFNDAMNDAQELAHFCKNVPCKVNIIEYNPIDDGEFSQAETQKVKAFANFLESKNIIVNIRRSRGKDIDAACGQLANKNALTG